MKISNFYRIGILVLMVATVVAFSSCTKTYHLTVEVNDPSMGTALGSGDYEPNSEVTIRANANSGYMFSRWNDGNTDNPRKVRISSDLSFTAFFEPYQDDMPRFETGTMTDGTGKEYETLKIGDMWWMAENLSVTTDATGQNILTENVMDHHTPLCYAYPNGEVLYNWAAAGSVCPDGWHLPTGEEWTAMEQIVGSYEPLCYEGDPAKIAKALAIRSQWKISSTPGTPGYYQMYNNTTGFGADPYGKYEMGFVEEYYTANFWTADMFNDSIAYNRTISYDKATVSSKSNKKNVGLSVRCVANGGSSSGGVNDHGHDHP